MTAPDARRDMWGEWEWRRSPLVVTFSDALWSPDAVHWLRMALKDATIGIDTGDQPDRTAYTHTWMPGERTTTFTMELVWPQPSRWQRVRRSLRKLLHL